MYTKPALAHRCVLLLTAWLGPLLSHAFPLTNFVKHEPDTPRKALHSVFVVCGINAFEQPGALLSTGNWASLATVSVALSDRE
jgi:hypothetical protein